MLYHLYDLGRAFIGPIAQLAQACAALHQAAQYPPVQPALTRHAVAACELAYRLGKTYERPGFGIASVEVGARTLRISEQLVAERPFCRLVHFQKERSAGARALQQPPVLLVAPLAGHHASLLRDTVRELLKDHDVFITDWVDARLAPVGAGEFGLDDYVQYLRDFIAILPPALHIVAVCQATVPVLGALALMASAGSPLRPRSVTLIAGPIDTRRAPTQVNRFATSRPLAWFRDVMIHPVPHGHPGAGRRVYPGFIQHACFVAMNGARHAASYTDFYLRRLDGRDSTRHCAFYDDYNATLDMPERFYLDTIDTVFQEYRLARGCWTVAGHAVRPQDIEDMALLTVEGERDDITAPGQTAAALELCAGIPAAAKHSIVAGDCGHYATFSGRHWRDTICPAIGEFIAKADRDHLRTHAVALQAA